MRKLMRDELCVAGKWLRVRFLRQDHVAGSGIAGTARTTYDRHRHFRSWHPAEQSFEKAQGCRAVHPKVAGDLGLEIHRVELEPFIAHMSETASRNDVQISRRPCSINS